MVAGEAASLLAGLVVLLHTCGAWADVQVNMEDRVEVFRGETAQITCMFTALNRSSNMIIHWLYETKAGEEKKLLYFQDNSQTIVDQDARFSNRINVSVSGSGASREVVLTITDVQLDDEVDFICLIQSVTDGSARGRTKLMVFVTPGSPTIEGVQTGISVNEGTLSKIGTCEVKNGFPKPKITWYRNSTQLPGGLDGVKVVLSITMESSGLYSVRSELSMKVMKEDKDATFYCDVVYTVPGGTRMTETSKINITVYYPSTAVRVWVESPKGKIKEGDTIELQCHGNGNSPSSILTIKHGDNESPLETANGMRLFDVTRQSSGLYQCVSLDTDTFEEISGNTTIFVNYLDPAVVTPANTNEVDQGEEFKATCNALSSLPTSTAWFKDGQEVWAGHILVLKNASFDSAGTYLCVVTVPEIENMETSGTVHVHVRGSPEIVTPENTEIAQSFESTVDLSCNVRGFPTPSVIWTTADGKVLTSDPPTVMEGVVYSLVSVKVTSDITVFCNASNMYGKDAVAFNIKALKAETPASPKITKKEGSGVIIAVVIICILLLAVLGSVLYFLYKKGKICGRSGKQDLTKDKSSRDDIVVEMKSDNTEEAVLLGVNGEKQPPSNQ